ncbi:MAG: FAD:protein FMN transferase [Candidatus Pseudobacter hemicellulosilyticus]|uniref:FAD:protein FMN transferase n=1 Tax=Candidatus Pseudobacter hemicellulosilyticus TaxID=3121375 RepID=A0AAJ6BHG5_9BACT|nr:MAG: FAD:protein FMN transferase [Pseudobacter sp.]
MNRWLFLLFLMPLLGAGPQQTLRPFHLSGKAQGTTWQLTYYAADSLVSHQEIMDLLDQLDSSLSIYKPWSLINRFNGSDTGVIMDKHLRTVVVAALDTWRQTEGIFDVTILPLVQAWGFGTKELNTMPDSLTILALKACVDSRYLSIEGNWLKKAKPCVKIDVNGIAQGYSVDEMASLLQQKGIRDYLVELGGELRVKGRRQPSGEPMTVGIEAPAKYDFEPRSLRKIIQITDSSAITTSGSYRKFVESNGKKISHILDPRTGYSAQNELISVTVLAPTAFMADAFDNALMAMGLEKALAFTEAHPLLAAYCIYRKKDGSIADTASSRFYAITGNTQRP